MKCFQCYKQIDESKPHKVTAPDGDVFHLDCLKEYEKEKERFYSEVIHDDKKFADWMGVSVLFSMEMKDYLVTHLGGGKFQVKKEK